MRNPEAGRPPGPVASALLVVVVALGLVGGSAASRAADRSFDCLIDPAEKVGVGSSTPGLLEQVLVDRGDPVRRGQVIARLQSEVEAATVALDRVRAGSNADIEAKEAQLKLARRQMERTEELFRRQVASEQKQDELRAQVDITERDLALARIARELAQLELKRSEAQLRQREIRSPIDGIVTERIMTGGEYVHQESVILRLARLNPLHVESFLPVKYYPRVQRGLAAVVEPAPPIPGPLKAEVVVVDQVFDAASGTFGVRLTVDNPDGRLPAGHRCRVVFSGLED